MQFFDEGIDGPTVIRDIHFNCDHLFKLKQAHRTRYFYSLCKNNKINEN